MTHNDRSLRRPATGLRFRSSHLLAFVGIMAASCKSTYLFGGGVAQLASAKHPSAGAVAEVPGLSQPAAELELERGLPPETLRQDARVVRADANEVCIEVKLRGLAPSYVDLRSWRIHLRTAKGGRVREHEAQPKIEADEVVVAAFEGNVPHVVQTGTETVCTRKDKYEACEKWEQRPVMSTQWQPGTVEVATGGGTLCYPASVLGPETTQLAIRLNSGQGAFMFGNPAGQMAADEQGPTRLTFQWNFGGDS